MSKRFKYTDLATKAWYIERSANVNLLDKTQKP